MNFLVKTFSVVATVAVASLMGMGINTFSHQKDAVAATNTLTGSCGGAVNFGRKGVTPEDGNIVNSFFRFDFQGTTAVAEFSMTSRQINNPLYDKGFKTEDKKQVTFAVSAGSLTGSHKLTPTILPPITTFPEMYVMSVNGGTTYLIQVVDDDITGICQSF